MGKRGPPPTPTAQLKVVGSWRAKTRKGEPSPDTEAPGCPSWLDAEAKREWKRVVPQLTRLGLLAEIDRAVLVGYCEAWAEYVNACRAIQTEGVVVSSTRGTLTKNPMLLIKNEARLAMLRFAQEFGLSPSARARVGAVKAKPEKASEGKTRFFGAG